MKLLLLSHIKYIDKICGLAALRYYFFPLYDRSIEGVPICKLRNRLLVATGGSLRFGCQDSAHSKQGALFQNSRRQ